MDVVGDVKREIGKMCEMAVWIGVLEWLRPLWVGQRRLLRRLRVDGRKYTQIAPYEMDL